VVTICDHLLKSNGDMMAKSKSVIRVGTIQQRILLVRGEKVIVDADLAEACGVPTRRLNEQVKRNKNRFPEEKAEVIANCDHLSKFKFSKSLPRVLPTFMAQ